jgi:hypothetical protein
MLFALLLLLLFALAIAGGVVLTKFLFLALIVVGLLALIGFFTRRTV